MADTWTITELANDQGITARAIRFYEDQGLISPLRDGRNRVYANRDRVRLKLILRGKRIGLSLAEIRDIINLYDTPEGEQRQTELLRKVIRERRAQLMAQQQDIAVMLHELDNLEARL